MSSSDLYEIMNEVSPGPSPSSSGGSWQNYILLFLAIVGVICIIVYLMPFLSSTEKEIEKIKEDVDSKKEISTHKIILDELEERETNALEEKGFCYIGTDRGIRSCIRVNPGDRCMSGEIFPRRDICVNPSLRL